MSIREPGPNYSNTFCIVPFLEVSMETSGKFCLCNDSVSPPLDRAQTEKIHYNMPENQIQKYWNSEYLRHVRKKMLAGEQLPECKICYEQESIGKSSKRLRENNWWNLKEFQSGIESSLLNEGENPLNPVYLHLRFGNLCNLKCRMCTAATSSAIYSEGRELEKNYNLSEYETYNFESAPQVINKDWQNNPAFVEQILKLTPNLRHICITGGEPSLAKPFFQFLQGCIENQSAKNIHLSVFTNLTVIPENYIELLSEFKAVELHASIDAYGALNEYIRYPSNWENTKKNFYLWRAGLKNATVKIWLTVQAYNILYLEPLLTWIVAEKIPFNMGLAIHPEHIHLKVLPLAAKKLAIEKIEKYIQITEGIQLNHGMTAKSQFQSFQNMLKKNELYREDLVRKFLQYTEMLDQKRNQKFSEVCPELAEFFNLSFSINKKNEALKETELYA